MRNFRESVAEFATVITVMIVMACAYLVGAAHGAYEVKESTQVGPNPYVAAVSSPAEEWADVDYRDGGWWVDDARVPLACPAEDDCLAEYRNGTWVFTRVAH